MNTMHKDGAHPRDIGVVLGRTAAAVKYQLRCRDYRELDGLLPESVSADERLERRKGGDGRECRNERLERRTVEIDLDIVNRVIVRLVCEGG